MPTRFLDTNPLIRYFTRDDPAKAAQVLALLERVERGEERVALSPLVVFECVFVLQHTYKLPRRMIGEAIGDVISLRGVQLPNKRLYVEALGLYVATSLSFADAYNASYMVAQKLTEIYSWDADFDKVPGLTRVEPI